MFDISFTEILVIAAVGLVIIGPERLPKVAHTLGHLFGRAQRYVNDVKNDIQREMELEELKKWKASVEGTARSIGNAVQTEITQFEEVVEVETKIKPSPPGTSASPENPAEAAPLPGSPSTQTKPTTVPAESKSSPEIIQAEAARAEVAEAEVRRD